MTPRKLSLLARLPWLLSALALAATMPLEGRGQQGATTTKPPAQATTPPATGTGVQGRSSTPPGARGADGRGAGGDQSRRGRQPDWLWWQDDAVKKELALTEPQVRSIDRLYQQREREMKPFLADLDKQNEELDKMTREAVVTPEELRVQVVKVQALIDEIFNSRTIMLYKMNLQLNADQRAKLPAIRERHRQQIRGGGPGAS